MITTRDELFSTSASIVVISKELAEGLYKSTRNAELKDLITSKDSVVLKRTLIDTLNTKLKQLSTHAQTIREKRVNKGGRPRLADMDVNSEEFKNLHPHEQLRYRNRIWKRQSRERLNNGH